MRNEILKILLSIEEEQDVTIPYGVESGSRAWGFESADSDYDVRFIYVRPLEDYLRIRQLRDVIELPLTSILDVNGWDLVKALNLFRASNPPLLEWLNSPIIYQEQGTLAQELRDLAQTCFSPRRVTYHYLSMANRNFKDFIEGKEEVRQKKYLYLLRPLFCIRWIEQWNSPPPTNLHQMLEKIEVPDDLLRRLLVIIEAKKTASEADSNPADSVINKFALDELERIKNLPSTLPDPEIEIETLNALFRRHVLH